MKAGINITLVTGNLSMNDGSILFIIVVYKSIAIGNYPGLVTDAVGQLIFPL